jgi:hypothetical protein
LTDRSEMKNSKGKALPLHPKSLISSTMEEGWCRVGLFTP